MRNGSGAVIEGGHAGLTFRASTGFSPILLRGGDGYDFVMIIAEPDT
jgi:hypothetical protein